MTNVYTRETIDIETSGGTVFLDLHNRTILDVLIRGDGAADYAVDVRSSDDGSWITLQNTSYSASADYEDTLQTGVGQVRIRCTTGTGTSGDSADILLSSGGN